jgi:hypothetical protein
LVTGV